MSKQMFYTTLGSKFNNPDALSLSGTLYIKVEGTNGIGYINAMKITEHE